MLTKTIPPTDAQCDFNWSRLRCEPKCSCGVRLRFGDYTPGRACRLLHPWEQSPHCEDTWDPSDEPAVSRFVQGVAAGLGSAKRTYEARIAPPTDSDCTFSFEARRCEPQDLCRLRPRVSYRLLLAGVIFWDGTEFFCRGTRLLGIDGSFSRVRPRFLCGDHFACLSSEK